MHFLRLFAVVLFLIGIFASAIVITDITLTISTATLKPHLKPKGHGQSLYPVSTTLLDLWNFRYVINNDVCILNDNTTVTAALIITSHAGDVEERNAIRLAYPTEELRKLGIRRVFLLALMNSQREDVMYKRVSQSVIEDENDRFSDLVQGNFYEAYRNLTYKHVMGLQWVVNYCKEAKFVIKMDEDIIVDFYRLLDLMKQTNLEKRDFLMGYVLQDMQAIRDKSNKWFVSRSEYPTDYYPPYLSGWMYVTTPESADRLLIATRSVNFFWIDDTYVTGFLAKEAGMKHKDIGHIFTIYPEDLECCLDDTHGIELSCDFIVGPRGEDYDLLLRFTKHAATCYTLDCTKREVNKATKKACFWGQDY